MKSRLLYCPDCGHEFREGVTICTDCGIALVSSPPPIPGAPTVEWLDLETVLETSDPALLPVVRSLLEAEDIPCFLRGELLQEFLGWGRLPSGKNFITGPVQLQVPRKHVEEARQLLGAVDLASFEGPADESVD